MRTKNSSRNWPRSTGWSFTRLLLTLQRQRKKSAPTSRMRHGGHGTGNSVSAGKPEGGGESSLRILLADPREAGSHIPHVGQDPPGLGELNTVPELACS